MGFPVPLFVVLGTLLNRLSPDVFEAVLLKGLGSLTPGITLLAAVSGGADSTALAAALSRLREGGKFRVRAAHVEHGIRPPEESRGDAKAVLSLCAGLDLDCRVLSVPPGRIAGYARRRGTGIEAAARRFRYRALTKEALRCGAGAIVTAHTGDDALELCLMRILRGSGPEGLGRMPPSRPLPRSGIAGKDSPPLLLLRPLLGLYRGDVESYLNDLGLSWRSDTTNSDERFLRNRIRAGLVPLLDRRFPGWRGGLEALGDTQRLAARFIGGEALRRVSWGWDSPGRGLRSGGGFFDQPLIVREEALFRGLNLFRGPHPGSGSTVKRRNLRRFARGEIRDIDLGFCRIVRDRGEVSLFRRTGGEAGFSLLIKEPGLYKLKRSAGLGLNSGGKAALRVWEKDSSARRSGEGGFFAALPLVLRLYRPGDGPGKPARSGPPKFPAGGEISGINALSVSAPCFQDRIIAQDTAGAAALIGVSCHEAVILWKREIRDRGDFFFCETGGIDAE